jgi:hypothetical protein
MTEPAWLVKRALEMGATRIVTVLAPVTPQSSAIYLLEAAGAHELHAVQDASTGIEGCTIRLSSREAVKLLATLAGALSGRIAGTPLAPHTAPEAIRVDA